MLSIRAEIIVSLLFASSSQKAPMLLSKLVHVKAPACSTEAVKNARGYGGWGSESIVEEWSRYLATEWTSDLSARASSNPKNPIETAPIIHLRSLREIPTLFSFFSQALISIW